ncbi:MAG: YecA family protein [Chthoniobacterales bacterium]
MILDWDWINETIPEVLSEIGTDDCLRQTAEFCKANSNKTKENYVLPFLSNIFAQVDSPLSAKLAIELLPYDNKDTTKVYLAEAIASQMDDETIPLVRQIYEEDPEEAGLTILVEFFYTHAVLTGSSSPEIEVWQNNLKDFAEKIDDLMHGLFPKNSPLAKLFNEDEESDVPNTLLPFDEFYPASPDIPYAQTKARPGRNDPYICGSGKKFKKCCMNKTNPNIIRSYE